MKVSKFAFCKLYILFALFSLSSCQKSNLEVYDIKVNFLSNIDHQPIFSWKVQSQKPGFTQSAAQVLIADNIDDIHKSIGNIWDSGKKNQMNPLQFKPSEVELESGRPYYARLRVWNDDGEKSDWSEAIKFYVPLDYAKDWTAQWITWPYQSGSPLPIFKKVFDLGPGDEIEHARLYIAAPGYYEAFLNGDKIGKNVLDPGQTNYEDYTYYTAYDIEPNALTSQNVLGVMLGNGWYNQNVVWGKNMIYGQPVFSCQLLIQYKDGQQEIIESDESWRWASGPITFTNVYAGETYDARLEVKDWFNAESTDSHWENAILSKTHPVQLYEQFAEPIQKMDEVEVQKVISRENGKYILDLGQNMAGWVRIQIEGQKGQEITMKFVEELDEKGNIDPRSTGVSATKVLQTLRYICKGNGREIWEPKFTYFGFRFVEVEGLTSEPTKDFLKGIVVHSALPQSGTFTCSDQNINKLHELAHWTLIGNIHSIPTDCPHREKCGWTGDAHTLATTLMYNFDAQRFMGKYMFDMRSSGREEKKELYFGESFHDRSIVTKPKGITTMIAPGRRTSGIASPDWGTAMNQVPWYLYVYCGDKEILKEFYPDMKIWVEYIHAKNKDGIITHGLGDWCPPGGNKNIDTPVSVSSTAFHILDVTILKNTAEILGHNEDANRYSQMIIDLKKSFNDHYYDAVTHSYGSQTGNALALDIDLVPQAERHLVAAATVKNIHDEYNGFINTGIFGLGRIFKALAENGFEDEAYRLLTKSDNNSFATMWKQFDATTLWEILPVDATEDRDMLYGRSHNHPMQAGFDAWFYSGIAGINPSTEAPGFKKIVFKPYLTQHLGSADASYESGFGTIRSTWQSNDESFNWQITIPAGAEGEIWVPNYGKKVSVEVNGKQVEADNYGADFINIGDYGSGKLDIQVTNSTPLL